MKANGIDRDFPCRPEKEFLRRGIRQSKPGTQVRRTIVGLTSPSNVNRSKGVSTRNFSGDVKVFFPVLASTVVHCLSPIGKEICGYLGSFIDTHSVDIEH
jgi:hypothetical protein